MNFRLAVIPTRSEKPSHSGEIIAVVPLARRRLPQIVPWLLVARGLSAHHLGLLRREQQSSHGDSAKLRGFQMSSHDTSHGVAHATRAGDAKAHEQ
jgi:hypothetical protein